MACLSGTPFLAGESEPVHSTGYRRRGKSAFPEGLAASMRKGWENLAGVSDGRERVRGEDKWRPSGAAGEQRSVRWRCT